MILFKLLKLVKRLKSPKRLKELKVRLFNNNSFYFLLTGGVFMMVTTSVVFYAEGILHQNEQYKTFWDAFWWFWVTATTVGYGDKFPQSFLGQIAGIIVMLGGVVLVGIIAAAVAVIGFLNGGNYVPNVGISNLENPSDTILHLVVAAFAFFVVFVGKKLV